MCTPQNNASKEADLVSGKFGHSFGSFTDSMLGEFTREHESDSSLDFSGRKGGLLVVSSKASSFRSNAFKDIIDEVVHDGHALLGNTSIRVDLLQDFVNVGAVGFSALLALGLGAFGGLSRSLGRLLGGSLGHGGSER